MLGVRVKKEYRSDTVCRILFMVAGFVEFFISKSSLEN